MASGRSAKAEEYIGAAIKKLKSWSLFGGSEQKYEDAADLYVKASTQFKLAKEYDRAAEAFTSAAECCEKIKDTLSATGHWREAGKMWLLEDKEKAKECFNKAINGYLDNDRFGPAAKLYDEIGKLLEESKDYKEAIEAYTNAGDMLTAAGDNSGANKRRIQVAGILGTLGKYKEAIEIYEDVSKENVGHQLLRWSVKNHLFAASICQLCIGAKANSMREAEDALEGYCDLSDLYAGTREAKLIKALIDAFENSSTESFEDAIFAYNDISKLNPWQTDLLHVVSTELRGEHEPNMLGDGPDLTGGAKGGGADEPNLLG